MIGTTTFDATNRVSVYLVSIGQTLLEEQRRAQEEYEHGREAIVPSH
jgi:hypothetical protein